MYSKRRQIPLGVSTWMEKDLTLRRITANSRLLTNDTRQNIVLSRQFFSDLLNLSFSRYRKLAECDFDKKIFLKNQQNKSESTMPGLRPYVDQLTHGMGGPTTSRMQSGRRGGDRSFISPSAQSLFSRQGTKSDLQFNRRKPSSIRQIKTAQITKPPPDITLTENTTTPTIERPRTSRQMSRETLNRLSQPKGSRFKSATSDHVRSNPTEITATAEEIFGEIDVASEVMSSTVSNPLPVKPKSAVDDKRFHHLLGAFSQVHAAQTPNLPTCKSIVAANTSLQDNEGQWKTEHPSVSKQKIELTEHRQMLAEKFHSRLDVFLIDVGA